MKKPNPMPIHPHAASPACDLLTFTGSRAIGLLRLLAIAATSDTAPPTLQEIDGILGLASDAGRDLLIAIDGANDKIEAIHANAGRAQALEDALHAKKKTARVRRENAAA